MPSDYDVIIIGAGPSGSALAHELARRSISVLIIDKEIFPRSKCCGGGLTFKARALLDGIPNDIIENTILSAVFNISGSPLFEANSANPLIFTVNREKFDYFLMRRAAEAGAEVIQGVTVTKLDISENRVSVITPQGSFRSKYAVGAEGNHSIVAKLIAGQRHNRIIGIETELRVQDKELEKWKSRILIDAGWRTSGYGWVFPKRDHLSVGIGVLENKASNLKRAYRQFLDSLKLDNYEIMSSAAAIIPIYSGRPRVAAGRLAVVGDAAGLADPLTGEGIGNSILSALYAAAAIDSALRKGEPSLQAYQTSIEEKLVPEIEAARFISSIIFSVPKRLLELAARDGRLWNAGCLMIRGETSYSAIRNRVGALKGLYSILKGRNDKLTPERIPEKSV